VSGVGRERKQDQANEFHGLSSRFLVESAGPA
jgi:hypothetical protein